jgi:hypothetical protein
MRWLLISCHLTAEIKKRKVKITLCWHKKAHLLSYLFVQTARESPGCRWNLTESNQRAHQDAFGACGRSNAGTRLMSQTSQISGLEHRLKAQGRWKLLLAN